ncbi:MAG TPA: NUDIX domain-containing protein [Marmoricola sp.]|jgi:isopentenyldiphosphate isomerase|nr:NUDIX domain-containing protein [Marmoricola sp.]
MTDEVVALVDRDGQVVGSAPRSVVRRDNLLHSATAVLVRDPARRIYVHRRSDLKDWAPGRWDVAAGGVMQLGEEPLASARRELEEELGVVSDALLELGTHLYEDDTTRCFEYAYEAEWDGPVQHQPEEVAEGRWVTSQELAAMLSDPAYPFVPDSRQLIERLAARGVSDYADLVPGTG